MRMRCCGAAGALLVGRRGRLVEYSGRGRQIAILLGAALVFAVVTFAIVWASFGFRYTAFAAATSGRDAFLGQMAQDSGVTGRLFSAARRFHLLPEAYLYASTITVQSATERAAF